MKTISDFEVEEYKKMLERLDIKNDDSEDKSQYFNAWNFGEDKGTYITSNELQYDSTSLYHLITK